MPSRRDLPPVAVQLARSGLRAAALASGAARFLRDRRAYAALPGAEPLRWRDTYPQLGDRVATSPFDPHYTHQDTWAAQRIAEHAPARHVDVGSRVDFVCLMTAITQVAFVDIRPLEIEIDGLESIAGSLLELPFADRSLESLSCLHVAEHIGLGRYGDQLDPHGTRKAIAELQRVLAPGGRLLFATPVGRPRVCFNAHRIHDPVELLASFDELELEEFAGVDDDGRFRRHREPASLRDSAYACGMYLLRRASVR